MFWTGVMEQKYWYSAKFPENQNYDARIRIIKIFNDCSSVGIETPIHSLVEESKPVVTELKEVD